MTGPLYRTAVPTETGNTMSTSIPIKRTRNRKPLAPRTCCDTHTDTCAFGRDHRWSMGWIGGPKSGLGIGEEGWHDSFICSECRGICVAELEEGQRA